MNETDPKEKGGDTDVAGIRFIVGDLAKNQGRMIGLFALLVIISGNFLAELFPPGVQKILNTNRYVKHVFAFLTLFFFVFLTMPDLKAEGASVVFGIYFIFLISSKLEPYAWFTILGLITMLYLIEIREDRIKTEDAAIGESAETDKTLAIIDNWIRPGAVIIIGLTTIHGASNVVWRYLASPANSRPNFIQYILGDKVL